MHSKIHPSLPDNIYRPLGDAPAWKRLTSLEAHNVSAGHSLRRSLSRETTCPGVSSRPAPGTIEKLSEQLCSDLAL